MTQLHAIHDQLAVQEALVTEFLAELQAIDEKAKLAVRFYEVTEWISQNEKGAWTWYQDSLCGY